MGVNKIAHVIDAVISLKDKFSSTLRNVNQNLSQFQKKANYIGRDITKVGKSVERVGSNLTTHVTLPLVALGSYAVKASSDFADGMAKIGTIADITKVPLSKLSKGILDLSNQTGMSVKDLTEAEYNALSAGVDTAKSVDFLKTAVKAAKGGFTDTNTAIDSLTTVLNAYGMKSEEVTKISDQMILAQNFGKYFAA